MRRKGSHIAAEIDAEYKRKQFMKKRVKRQMCKDKDCIECKWNPICEDKEGNNEDCNK